MRCDLCDEHVDPDDYQAHCEQHRLDGEGIIDSNGCEIFDVPECINAERRRELKKHLDSVKECWPYGA